MVIWNYVFWEGHSFELLSPLLALQCAFSGTNPSFANTHNMPETWASHRSSHYVTKLQLI